MSFVKTTSLSFNSLTHFVLFPIIILLVVINLSCSLLYIHIKSSGPSLSFQEKQTNKKTPDLSLKYVKWPRMEKWNLIKLCMRGLWTDRRILAPNTSCLPMDHMLFRGQRHDFLEPLIEPRGMVLNSRYPSESLVQL